MNEWLRRAAAPGLVTLLLTTACGDSREATGECRGTLQAEQVDWPIDGEDSRLVRDRFGFITPWLFLNYLPDGQATLSAFGADVELADGTSLARGDVPRTAQLLNTGFDLAPEQGSAVKSWQATRADSVGSGTGFPERSGVPANGTLTLEVLADDHAEGRFVYRYANGDELTCTFDVPTPAAAGSIWDGGGGGGDDDDDD
ncbi:hypothetical protein LXT21_13515 [Myxococcus sp. K38C18041901]|uniref:hypothetical protein n=1 Tax=Myxococcus guangdongensis TaxID=2906760 RepID=UPI0020A755C2|nr:hypothetical protein [Myxococcus guangdongensis]MCP3059797.1 hypothetical protein [Myxococcus guangdongensis]